MITIAERWHAAQSPVELHADCYQINIEGIHVGAMSGGELGSSFCLHLFGDGSGLECAHGPLDLVGVSFLIMFGSFRKRDANMWRAASEWLNLAYRWELAHPGVPQRRIDLDFENHISEAMAERTRRFTTMAGPLTVVGGEGPFLWIEGADREWYFDRAQREFYWVDRGVTPQTWVPYRHEAGKWEQLANIYEIVGTAPYEPWRTIEPVWRAVGDSRVLALLSALEKAVEDYHLRHAAGEKGDRT